jgi:glucose dehydrogenase
MMKRAIFVLSAIVLTVILAIVIAAQGRGGGGGGGQGPATPQIAAPNVTPDRLLKATAEPQNWLMYSGTYASQRHSPLTQITTANAKDLSLKWVFQSRSLEKSEVTPLVVNGVMYTTQSINDVIALNAVTGKTLWTFSYKPDPGDWRSPATRSSSPHMTPT